MPYILEDLVVDRVDLVDEGANTGAFIEVFKRKESTESMNYSEILSKMKPEHAEVVQQQVTDAEERLAKANEENTDLAVKLEEANTALAKANEDLANVNEELAKANEELETLKAADTGKGTASFDEEEVLKSMPENMRNEFIKMREQKEAAEEQVRKAAEEKLEAEAVAKANSLKALPVEQSTLVQILKSCDSSVVEVLTTVANAIEGTVLDEVGKSGKGNCDKDAWSKIEAEAEKVAKRDSVTKQKAIATVIKEQPELYKEYLNGGTN